MKIIIEFKTIEAGSQATDIILNWMRSQMEDKSTDNLSLLRYADSANFVDEITKPIDITSLEMNRARLKLWGW